jgi:4-hydroxyphenylpyruvate dioxygenase-like putative hemolysin
LPSFAELENMANKGSFNDMPPVTDVLDFLDLSTPDLLFTRIRDTLLKKMGYDKQQQEAEKLAKKKRKESHSATVCECLYARVLRVLIR